MPELGDPISERELDVLNCLADGDSNREIAQRLSISPNTVKVHVRNIFAKLGVSSRTEATTVALQKGVLSIPGVEVQSEEDEEAETGTETEGGERTLQVDADGEASSEQASVTAADDHVQDGAPRGAPRHTPGRTLIYVVGVIAISALIVAGLAATGLFRPATSSDLPTATAPSALPTAEPFAETEVAENWFESRPLPVARAQMAVAAVGLDVYAIGGQTASGIDNSVVIFDTQNRTWRTGAAKLTTVANAGAAVLAGEIYVVGGRGENEQATTAVEAYSPLNDGWRPVTPLPQPVSGGVALASGGLLYLFGGQDEGAVLDSAFVFSPATQQWQALPALQQARAFASGGVLGGKLYVAGGSDGTKALASCEVFDPATNAWSVCADMTQPRAGAGAAVLLNKLYVLGGGLHGDVSSGEVYDASGGSWSDVPVPMLEETAGWPSLGVASVETHIYALGGMRDEVLSDATYVYRPLVYQFFIPAASSGEGEGE